MPSKQTKVIDAHGKLLGTVSANATSIGAAKVAGEPVHYVRRNGEYVWETKAGAFTYHGN